MVRTANFADIPAIVMLLHDGYQRSHYAKNDLARIDVKEAKRLLVQAIQRHGHTTLGACWVVVAETDGEITGLILGTLHRVYAIGDKLTATDLFFVANARVKPIDPWLLAKSMVEWAMQCPDVVEVKCGTTAIIRDDPKEAGRIYERLGFTRYGEIYRAELAR